MDKFRRALTPLAKNLGLAGLIRISGQRNIFPFYHTISKWHVPHIRHLYRYRKVTDFEHDLDEMMNRFTPVSLGDYLKEPGKKPRECRMVLSFDDGLEECHQFIAPMLRRKGIPAVFFLNNDFIDNRGLFYRYKASLLIDHIRNECKAREKASEYLVIPEEQLEKAMRMITYPQRALLDGLAKEVEFDFTEYLKDTPVYMNSGQISDLLHWGFEIGSHSADHADFSRIEPDQAIARVKESIRDLQLRFKINTRYFAFPFTSGGVSHRVIQLLLREGIAEAVLGTAGLKQTGDPRYIERIPMEVFELPAGYALRTEFLYYVLKAPLGRNRLR